MVWGGRSTEQQSGEGRAPSFFSSLSVYKSLRNIFWGGASDECVWNRNIWHQLKSGVFFSFCARRIFF